MNCISTESNSITWRCDLIKRYRIFVYHGSVSILINFLTLIYNQTKHPFVREGMTLVCLSFNLTLPIGVK